MNNDSHKQPPIQWPSQQKGQVQAENLARQKVNALFGDNIDKPQTTDQETPKSNNTTPIQQATQPSRSSRQTTQTANQQPTFYEYHTAWQSYYQNYFQQYYDRAYKQAQKSQTNPSNEESSTQEAQTTQTIAELKQKLRNTVSQQTILIKSNRHFKPALASLTVGLGFILINYNQVVFGAARQYIIPSATANTPLIMAPGNNAIVNKNPIITIPKIGVEAPVVYTETSFIESKVDKALEKGVVHYGTTPLPGENGNSVFLGHSSSNVFSAGNYKYVFVNLDKLNINDTISLNYNDTRYTYKVTVARKIIKPTDTSVLAIGKKPIITLITCTPVGTNINRLVVQAEQISPNINDNRPTHPEKQSQPTNLPATSKSLWGSLFE